MGRQATVGVEVLVPLRIATAEGHGHGAGTQTPQEGLLAGKAKKMGEFKGV